MAAATSPSADLAERRPAPGDRRRRIIVLTESGRAAPHDTGRASRRVTDDLRGQLKPEEREALHTLLPQVAEDDLSP